MKCIHTADWHIGQSFYGYDRKHEHQVFFSWLSEVVRTTQADCLLVSGDVFDSPNPSAESQGIYYRFIRELTQQNPHLQILIIAGNHDSAARLEAPKPLLAEFNVQVVGSVKKLPNGEIDLDRLLIPLKKDGKTQAWCLAVPYLRQGDYPSAASYDEGVTLLYHALYQTYLQSREGNQPCIAMGHLHASGAQLSEKDRSERIVIGGLDLVSARAFDFPDLVYVALGHLHRAQKVTLSEKARYAGAPLPMSFAEKFYKQGVNLLELQPDGKNALTRIEFDPPVRLLSLPQEPQELPQVLQAIAQLEEGAITPHSPFLELKVLITQPEPSLRYQIEEALKNKSVRLAVITAHTPAGNQASKSTETRELHSYTPMEMAQDVFQKTYATPMPDTMKQLLLEIIKEVNP